MNTVKKNASKIAKNTESKITVYDIIYNKIVENKEKAEKEGRAFHWIKTWDTNGIPMSYTTQKPYKGVNLLFLEGGEYITFKQVQELQKKGQDISIKRGAKSDQVFFASQKELTEEEKQEIKAKRKEAHENAKKIITFLNEDDAEWEKANEEKEEKGDWFWKYYRAFNVEEYIEGLKLHRQKEAKKYQREECHNKADIIVTAYLKANKITFREHGMDAETNHTPWGVSIIIPRKKNFVTQYSYYSTLLHECIHSTRSFLKKDDLGKRDNKPHDKKTQKYSYEELVAQIGSNMLLNTLAIFPEDEKFDGVNDYAYLNDWMAKLKDQKRMIVMAANDAQKAADYFLQVAEKELQENPQKYAEVEKVEGFYKIDISDFIKLENFLKEYNETEEEAEWRKFIKGGFLRQDDRGNLYDYMPPVKSFQEYKEELIKLYEVKEILKEYEEDNKELITDPKKIKIIEEVKRTLAEQVVKAAKARKQTFKKAKKQLTLF